MPGNRLLFSRKPTNQGGEARETAVAAMASLTSEAVRRKNYEYVCTKNRGANDPDPLTWFSEGCRSLDGHDVAHIPALGETVAYPRLC